MPKNRETTTNNFTNAKKRRSYRNIHLCFMIRHFYDLITPAIMVLSDRVISWPNNDKKSGFYILAYFKVVSIQCYGSIAWNHPSAKI